MKIYKFDKKNWSFSISVGNETTKNLRIWFYSPIIFQQPKIDDLGIEFAVGDFLYTIKPNIKFSIFRYTEFVYVFGISLGIITIRYENFKGGK